MRANAVDDDVIRSIFVLMLRLVNDSRNGDDGDDDDNNAGDDVCLTIFCCY